MGEQEDEGVVHRHRRGGRGHHHWTHYLCQRRRVAPFSRWEGELRKLRDTKRTRTNDPEEAVGLCCLS